MLLIKAEPGDHDLALIRKLTAYLETVRFTRDHQPDDVECLPSVFELDVTDCDPMPPKVIYLDLKEGGEFEAEREDIALSDGRLVFTYRITQ